MEVSVATRLHAERRVSGFRSGALVRARGREWVVLPGDLDEVILARPLGGREDEATLMPLAIRTRYSSPPSISTKRGSFGGVE